MARNAYEVIRVIDTRFQVDPESYQRRYRAPAGRVLAPGCYLARRADEDTQYDELTEYIGPFDSVKAAEAALRERVEQATRAGHAPRERAGDPSRERAGA